MTTLAERLQSMPKRIQRKRTKGWRLPPNARCVDRSTDHWGNPFQVYSWYPEHFFPAHLLRQTRITDLGHTFAKVMDAEHASDLYRWWINQEENRNLRKLAQNMLRGSDLACWCPINQACHADVLLEIANAEAEQ